MIIPPQAQHAGKQAISLNTIAQDLWRNFKKSLKRNRNKSMRTRGPPDIKLIDYKKEIAQTHK
jgi:hypothetical protein